MSKLNKELIEPGSDLDQRLTQMEKSAAFHQLLHQARQQLEPRLEFTQQLEARLKTITQPNGDEARKPIRQRPVVFRRTPFRLASLGLALVALLIVGLALSLVVFSVPAASAAEQILLRAGQTATNTGLNGLQSYHGQVVSQGRSQATQPLGEISEEVWYKAPGSYRSDRNLTTLTGDGIVKLERYIFGSDGLAAWSYATDQKILTLLDPNPVNSDNSRRQGAFGTGDPGSILQNANRFFNARIIGAETVAGRPTHIIELTPKPTPEQELPFRSAAHIKLWVDQQNYLQLAAEFKDKTGILLFSMRYTKLEVNIPLDDNLFLFTPPVGIQIIDQRPPTVVQLDAAWEEAAREVSYKLFRPGFVPAGLTPSRPQFHSPYPGALNANYAGAQGENIYNLNKVVIMEKPAGSLQIKGETVQVGQLKAIYLKEGDLQHFFLEIEGTAIAVTGDKGVTKEQLLQIVQSLKPVSVQVTPTPTGK